RQVRNLLVLPRSFWEAGKLLSKLKPQVVVGVGGYVAGPVMLEAALAGIPTLLIEPNVRPGFTNRALAPFIRLAALGFAEAALFYGRKARVTGHPVRRAFSQVAAKRHAAPFTVLILGGSQGSRAINEAVVRALPGFRREAGRIRIVHQTGERDFARVSQACHEAGVAARVHPFIEDVPRAFAQADLVVCRSGASTVAELMAAGKASLLIPFPAATDDHQLANARVLERGGAARVLVQKDLDGKSLLENIAALLSRPEALAEMDRCARAMARPEAAAEIACLIEELAGKTVRPQFRADL
ncbi:MAG: UDP-N-acetylglucosamine--N-acetylmuramyl-(pentapeptide) pyrophosphoryl-undecaprenol N-acetylglucosamine transferase, partial [Terriglobia bacterium]